VSPRVVVSCIALLTLGLACNRPGSGGSVSKEPDSPLDRQSIEQLRTAGSDLSKPHTIQFHLRVPSQKDANAAATELQAGDYDTAVRQDRDGRNWLCVAQKSMTPTIENLSGARRMFMDLAARYHGEYDGWDAAVEP
jgi:regulator of RNase E activity RraB